MEGTLRHEGDVWAVQLDGRTARVRDSRGLHHLAVLLGRPGHEVHAIELAGAPEAVASSSAGPLLDERARAEYKRRLTDLGSDLDEAQSFNDGERAARIQAEIDALVDQLTSATGIGGRDRGAVSDSERARISVRRAIKSALDRITEAHPPLGAHLAATVRTGTYCSYVPDPRSPVRWLIGDAPEPAIARPAPARPLVVGRASEQSSLADAWSAARRGDGRLVTLCGEPGIGKTTLLRDLAATVVADGGVALRGRCDDHLGVPYQPVIEVLRDLVTVDGPAVVIDDAGAGAGVLARLVPELGAGSASGEAPDSERLLLFDTVTRVLTAAAARRPLLVAVDDLHWAPQPTLAMLLHVLRDAAGAPLLGALTYRDTEIGDELAGFLASLARLSAADRIGLAGIDVEAVVELGATVDDAKVLVEHTGGNPFFVRALLDSPRGTVLPSTVLDVIDDRVRRLSPEGRRLVTLVAVAGERVEWRVAADLAGSIDPIDELLDAGLLVEEGASVAFPHALVRRAIAASTSGVRSAALHLEVARALEAASAPAAALALHFGEASMLGETEPAIRYATMASEAALRAYAWEEAIAHAERGLAIASPGSGEHARLLLRLGEAHNLAGDPSLATRVLDTAAEAAIALADPCLFADVALERGHKGGQVGAYDPSFVHALRDAIERLGGADPTRRARLLARLAIEQSAGGKVDEARLLASDALDLARTTGDDRVILNAVRAKYLVLDAPEHIEARAILADELDTLARACDDLSATINAVGVRGLAAAETGDVDALDAALVELHDLVVRSGLKHAQWFELEQQVLRAVIAGDLDRADELAARELEAGIAAGVPNAFRGYGLQLLVIRHEQGRGGELAELALASAASEGTLGFTVMAALACADAGDDDQSRSLLATVDFDALPRDTLLLGILCSGAELALRLGDTALAAIVDQQLRPFVGRNVAIALGTITIGPVDRYLSYTARALGDVARARRHLEDAIALDERMRAAGWLARDRNDLAALGAAVT